MSQPYGVALIGCGEIGLVRAASLAQTSSTRLVVACDTDAARVAGVTGRYKCAGEADWHRAIARPDVDIVNIATPTAWHAEIAIAAAAEGKHILVEKPLARNVGEARRMVEAARAAGVSFKTGFNHRHYHAVAAAKQALDGGAIGSLMFVRSYIGHEGGRPFLDTWMTNAEIAGGGTLLDNGIHILDLTRYFLGEVADAQGVVTTARWDVAPLEDNAFAIFRSPAGCVATVGSSWTEWAGYRFMIEAYGTEGFVRAAYPPMRATIGVNHASGRPARKRHMLFPLFQVQERIYGYQFTTRFTFVREFDELATAIRTGAPVFSSGVDGLRAVEMADAVYRSGRDGTRVTL